MPTPLVIPQSDVRDDPAVLKLVGPKAAGLARLSAAGFPVPDGLCLTTEVFRSALKELDRPVANYLREQASRLHEPAVAQETAETIDRWLHDLEVPAGILSSLQQKIDELVKYNKAWKGARGLLAVRSSATAEDLPTASFAGHYATVLGTRSPQDLATAILTCWRSYYSALAMRERAAAGLMGEAEGMAVLIQPLIAADCAGVCFTVDPVNPYGGLMVVNAAWGLGPGVVDGSVATDSLWLNRRTLSVDRQQIVPKAAQIIAAGKGQLHLAAVPEEQQAAACLPPAWARRLAELCLTVEQAFGAPQDIEWVISKGQIWLLQSRPLTTLPPDLVAGTAFPITWSPETDRDYRWEIDVRSLGPTPLLPLELDVQAIWESPREETCRIMGVEQHQESKLFNGRVYSRPIPLGLSEADKKVRQAAMADLKDRLREQGWTSWDYWGPEVEQAVRRLRDFNLHGAGGRALADHLAEAMAVVCRHASIHPRAWFKPEPIYFEAYVAVSGAEDEAAAYQLLDGSENMLTHLVEGLYQLAQEAGRDPQLAGLIRLQPLDPFVWLAQLPTARQFQQKLAEFMAVHGERTGDGYGSEKTILEPTWQETPEKVLELVAAYLESDIEDPVQVRLRAREMRDRQAAALCDACPDKAAVANFQKQLAYARHALATLEDHNYWIEQASTGRLRLAVMAAARDLCERRLLADPGQVFWLTFAEITAALREEATPDLAQLIHERQNTHHQQAQFTPPPVIGRPSANLPSRPPWGDDLTVTSAGDSLTGLGASPGQVEGRAVVVSKGTGTVPVEPGDILVAENAGPLWTPYFPLLGGLILERGSLGQHAAVTAREYGIPAIIDCLQATRLIRDGDTVVIDGKEGTVTISSTRTQTGS